MLLVCWEEGELLKKDVLDTAEDALLAFAALDNAHLFWRREGRRKDMT